MRYEKPSMVVNVLDMCEVVRTSVGQDGVGDGSNINTGNDTWPKQ